MSTPFSDTTAGKVFNFVIGREKKKHSHGDPSREVFETIVFVVVLVLMLKLFVAEAFVIPTGSMASTLWGDQIVATCPECGHKFPVTASASQGPRIIPQATFCQNCGLEFAPANATDWSSGDRVLVGKYAYHIGEPHRFDVPVFKYPKAPYNATEKTAMNYIKRLIGLPGETIAIYKGDLYRATSLHYEGRPRPREGDRPVAARVHVPERRRGGQTVPRGDGVRRRRVRADPQVARGDPDRPSARLRPGPGARSLSGVAKVRWNPVPDHAAGWAEEEKGFKHEGTAEGWLRYHHVRPGSWTIDPATQAGQQPRSAGRDPGPPVVQRDAWLPGAGLDPGPVLGARPDRRVHGRVRPRRRRG